MRFIDADALEKDIMSKRPTNIPSNDIMLAIRCIDNAPTVGTIPDCELSPNLYDAGYEYKAVRSYTDNCKTAQSRLDTALADGYEFVRASEVVKNSGDHCDYIEYILRRRKQND